MSKKLLGIDLGGTTVKFGILTADGEVQEKWANCMDLLLKILLELVWDLQVQLTEKIKQ